MQTTRTFGKWTNSEDRSRRRAIGANLIVIGAVVALAAVALLILMADPGGKVPTSPAAPSAAVDAPAPPAADPADQDRSWLCNVISDDSAPESQVAAKEILARGGIACADGPLLDTHPLHGLADRGPDNGSERVLDRFSTGDGEDRSAPLPEGGVTCAAEFASC